MKGKATGVILIGFIVLSLLPLPGASGAESGIVILVTDNEADLAVAKGAAELLGAEVVVSPWGTYSPEVSAEILSAAPGMVIIIGGPVALPEDYTGDLKDFGIPYERWYGETRYGTNLAVIQGLAREFPEVLRDVSTVVVANGRDALALREYANSITAGTGEKPLLVLTDEGKTNETLEALSRLTEIRKIRYIATEDDGRPMFPLNKGAIQGFVREHFGGNVSVEERTSPPGPRDALIQLAVAENRTTRAEELLDGLQIPQARERLEKARGLLQKAREAYGAGDYVEAYALSVRASGEADFVIARAYSEVRTIYQGSAKIKLQVQLSQLEAMLKVLKARGYDVSEAEELLQEARGALERGDYSYLINDLIPMIKEKIAEETVWKGGIPRPPGPPSGRDKGKP
ncbi:hypothetical protein CL1_1600 [Thermococcus cleftensis]|uniref:Cell wall-binding repeat 2 family protein n=1 Tax=Thermococcus cleftensis (strain DSM 27260 / KACC 17922 / CL1) TaxID=163003 RepID=I3ZVR3_THECF|nr:cell wall-binding repeat-containing protein [Thermococcus cleftensis]AFL95797.1 hypothetical protein CL1_1600 [Thermococcus cleftensis]